MHTHAHTHTHKVCCSSNYLVKYKLIFLMILSFSIREMFPEYSHAKQLPVIITS